MRTTYNDLVGRAGGAYSKEQLEDVLTATRKLLADTRALLELETDRLFQVEFDEEDSKRMDQLQKLIADCRKAATMVLDLESKVGLSTAQAAPLDLEAARDEILSRLARLAA